jgi:crossover junction endodeoxyribonuclease RuvC
MRVLGIDPGYAIVGYGIIEYQNGRYRPAAYGAVTTPAGMAFNTRLEKVYDDILMLIEKYKPDAVSIEKLFFHTNQKTAIGVAEARGVILLACMKGGTEIFEYTPLQVKMAVTGYGRAQKAQIMTVTKSLLGLKETPKPDDTADALALAICHCRVAGTALKQKMLKDSQKSAYYS